MIENYRSMVRSALRAGDLDEARFLIRIIVGIRICAGEIAVKLKTPKIVLV